MNSVRNKLSASQPLIYLGIVALLSLLCVVVVLALLSRQPSPPAPLLPEITFVTVTPSPTSINQVPSQPSCASTPAGWQPYTVKPGETLSELAAQFQMSQGRILRANCLTSSDLLAGQQLYLPPLPTPTPCPFSPPASWELYTVQSGDNLFNLAVERGITVDEVTRLNCLLSSDIVVGQQFYLPRLPTPTPCVPAPPADWELYTIQSGDTLFGLAAIRGTTTDLVIQVNCLSSPDIIAGQQLYLPRLPTPTSTEPPTPGSLPTSIPTLVIQPTSALQPSPDPASTTIAPTSPPVSSPPPTNGPVAPTFPIPSPLPADRPIAPTPPPLALLAPGDPGEDPPPELVHLNFLRNPCDRLPTTIPIVSRFINTVELGERRYFFACNFVKPMSATITRSDGVVEPLELLDPDPDSLPNPYLGIPNSVKAIIEWSALPTLPVTGRYKLVVTDSNQLTYTREIIVVAPEKSHILVTPQTGPPGTEFIVYYVNFTSSLTLTLDLHHGPWVEGDETKSHMLDYWHSYQVPITQSLLAGGSNGGWARMKLPLEPTAPQGVYNIGYEQERRRQPDWLFWIR